MILIIAEKPSLARNIVDGIGNCTKKAGYYENDKYIVTWAFGHLFSLCDIEDYTGPTSTGKWSMENLPCFPENFKFRLKRKADKTVDSGISQRFNIIKALCMRTDVDKIVNAGDADREGEIIIRLCVSNAMENGINKPFLRLWLPDQTPETVREALESMKDESEYDNLANEGLARTYIDWLYGVNLTRFATLKTGTLLRVGRVIVPIVKAIYDRDMAIKNFVPEIYYAIVSKEETNGYPIELCSKEKFSKNEAAKAKEYADYLNLQEAFVIDKKKKKTTLQPGKLYSLSKLQNYLGKKYKMPMEESLQAVQDLYERGFLTYPRTNSEYLATTEKDKIKKIVDIVKAKGYKVKFRDSKTIFDDSKIESHSALTPTYKIPSKNDLTERQFLVYQAVFRRFAAVFCAEECKAEKTEIIIKAGNEEFTLKGISIIEKGWTQYDDGGQKDKLLPPLQVGDKVNTDFKPTQKETAPPKHYTIETLNNYLKNPFREDKKASNEDGEENDAEDYKAIFEGLELGTEATRTGIIENAQKSKYIELKKGTYYLLPDGAYMIESLFNMGIEMDKYKTSTMGKALKKVYRNEYTVSDSIALAKDEIAQVFAKKNNTPEYDTDTGLYGDYVGECPLCHSKVVKGKYNYGCMGYKEGCKFKVSMQICKRVIPISAAKKILETGSTGKICGFVSKNGKSFDATLKLSDGQIVFDFS